jgi:hypothetical protein
MNGHVFKVGSSIKSSYGKREMPLRKKALKRQEVESKSSERNQGSEQVFDPLSQIGEVSENLDMVIIRLGLNKLLIKRTVSLDI